MRYKDFDIGYCPHKGCLVSVKILVQGGHGIYLYPYDPNAVWQRHYRRWMPCGHVATADRNFYVK